MIFKDAGVTSHATWLHVDGKDSSGEGKVKVQKRGDDY